MVARANYHGFHVANVLSDPPSPQSLMETGAERCEPSPPTWSHPTRNKVCARDKAAAGPSLVTEVQQNLALLPITRVKILD